VLFHRVANTLNYLDIKTVVVSCGTCYDQLQGYEFEKIFPGCRIIDIHEYLLEKGITLQGQEGYLYHDPCHSPMKLQDPMKTVKALVGDNVLKNDRCCGESGTLGVTRPDISTQIRFRKEEELKKGEAQLRDWYRTGTAPEKTDDKAVDKAVTDAINSFQNQVKKDGDFYAGQLLVGAESIHDQYLHLLNPVSVEFYYFMYSHGWNCILLESIYNQSLNKKIVGNETVLEQKYRWK
jgi:hypothetical protein